MLFSLHIPSLIDFVKGWSAPWMCQPRVPHPSIHSPSSVPTPPPACYSARAAVAASAPSARTRPSNVRCRCASTIYPATLNDWAPSMRPQQQRHLHRLWHWNRRCRRFRRFLPAILWRHYVNNCRRGWANWRRAVRMILILIARRRLIRIILRFHWRRWIILWVRRLRRVLLHQAIMWYR